MRLPTSFLRRLYNTSSTSSSSSPKLNQKQSQISSYLSSLRSKYPQADAPSLIASFLILHELTAIIPLFLGFWGLKSLGVGEELSNWVRKTELSGIDEGGEKGWGKEKVGEWIVEGEKQASMIGRRYGTFGFEKESKEDRIERKRLEKELIGGGGDLVIDSPSHDGSIKIAGDVANLVVAYIAVKVSSIFFRCFVVARLFTFLFFLIGDITTEIVTIS